MLPALRQRLWRLPIAASPSRLRKQWPIVLGRACHATSKRGFAPWARNTTLGELFAVDVERLTSQHFWDQMEQLPVETIAPIEREIVGRVVERFGCLSRPSSTTPRTSSPSSPRPKTCRASRSGPQQTEASRSPAGRVGFALHPPGGDPLWHRGLRRASARRQVLRRGLPLPPALGRDGTGLESLTLVYDKGNVSRANQSLVDTSKLHYVASLSAASQRLCSPKRIQDAAGRFGSWRGGARLSHAPHHLGRGTHRHGPALRTSRGKARSRGFSSMSPRPNGGSLGWTKPSREASRGAIASASNTTSTPASEDASTFARS